MSEDLHGYFTDTGCVRCTGLLAPERNITDFAILNRCEGSFTYIETALEYIFPLKEPGWLRTDIRMLQKKRGYSSSLIRDLCKRNT